MNFGQCATMRWTSTIPMSAAGARAQPTAATSAAAASIAAGVLFMEALDVFHGVFREVAPAGPRGGIGEHDGDATLLGDRFDLAADLRDHLIVQVFAFLLQRRD